MDARVGETAPAFTMDTTAGRRSLDDYRGRTLVLAFFPLAFTGG
jgi:peroxiredoxin